MDNFDRHLRDLTNRKAPPLSIDEVYGHRPREVVSPRFAPLIIGVVVVVSLLVAPMLLQPPPPANDPSPPISVNPTATTVDEREKTRAEQIQQILDAREDYVATCMAEAGFVYIPLHASSAASPEPPGLGIHMPHVYDPEYAAGLARIEGFNLFVTDLAEVELHRSEFLMQGGPTWLPDDPNFAIRLNLSTEEQTAYDLALFGSAHWEIPTTDGPACQESALEAIPRPPLAAGPRQLLEQVHAEFDARLTQDPRIAQARADADTCATDAAVDPDGLRRQFTQRTGLPHSHENLLAADPDVVKDLRAEEIRQAEALARCEQIFFDAKDAVGFELERSVVEEIPGAMAIVVAEQGR